MEIYATNISNLTDARYFAALGAKWMEISISRLNMNATEFNAMKEWVTGVKWVLHLADIKSNSELDFISDTQMNYLSGGINNEEDLNFVHLSYVKSLTDLILENSTNKAWIIDELDFSDPQVISHLKLYAKTETIYLNIELKYNENIVQAIIDIEPAGIVFKGGSEEKTGFKSYDEIDEFVELLIQADLLK